MYVAVGCNARADYFLDNGKIVNIHQGNYAKYIHEGDTAIIQYTTTQKPHHLYNTIRYTTHYTIHGIYRGMLPMHKRGTRVLDNDTVRIVTTYHIGVRL